MLSPTADLRGGPAPLTLVGVRSLQPKPNHLDMRGLGIPFRFDLRALLERARRLPVQVDSVAINLPFLSVTAKPDHVERQAAREIIIRMSKKRVLNSHECCDTCIEVALQSLQEIRALLVDKQVVLMDRPDSVLFLLLDMMLVALNQFLTFTQRIGVLDRQNQEAYFAALEVLRAHLYRCIAQIARIADYPVAIQETLMRYDDAWQLDAYEPPQLSNVHTGAVS
jgi:hypothetical protein